MIVLLRVSHVEGDDDLGEEALAARVPRVRAGVERDAVDPLDDRVVVGHEGAAAAVSVGVTLADQLEEPRGRLALQLDRNLPRRLALRRVEDVRRDERNILRRRIWSK